MHKKPYQQLLRFLIHDMRQNRMRSLLYKRYFSEKEE